MFNGAKRALSRGTVYLGVGRSCTAREVQRRHGVRVEHLAPSSSSLIVLAKLRQLRVGTIRASPKELLVLLRRCRKVLGLILSDFFEERPGALRRSSLSSHLLHLGRYRRDD